MIPPTKRPRQILIVEDEALIVMHLKEMLENGGYEVPEFVSSGEEAIAYLEHAPLPDLILMDIRLDGKIDGIETARRIRQQFTIPIIFISGNLDQELIKQAGIPCDMLTKPFSPESLMKVITRVLR